MAYAVKITKVADEGALARYAWRSTTGRSGNVLLATDAKLFRPCDELGNAVGEMSLRGNGVGNPDPETVQDFVAAVGGVFKKWKGSGLPPETARLARP